MFVFLSGFKNAISLSSFLHSFWWVVRCQIYFSFPGCNVLIFSGCFQGSMSIFRFWQHDFDLPRPISSVFISFWEIHLSEFYWIPKFKVFTISGCFQPVIMKIFYSVHLLSPFFLELQLHVYLMIWYFPACHWHFFSWNFFSLWLFFELFPIFLSLMTPSSTIFKLTHQVTSIFIVLFC